MFCGSNLVTFLPNPGAIFLSWMRIVIDLCRIVRAGGCREEALFAPSERALHGGDPIVYCGGSLIKGGVRETTDNVQGWSGASRRFIIP